MPLKLNIFIFSIETKCLKIKCKFKNKIDKKTSKSIKTLHRGYFFWYNRFFFKIIDRTIFETNKFVFFKKEK